MKTAIEKALSAIKDASRDAEKEATRLEVTNPELSKEARERADGLALAKLLLESVGSLAKTIRTMENVS